MHSLVRYKTKFTCVLSTRCNRTYHHFQEIINVQGRQVLKGMQT